jgi:gluconolactonase
MFRTLLGSFCLLFASGLFAQDMPLTQVLVDGEPWQQVAEGFKFTEGPAVDAEGNIYFTDIPNNRIHKLDVASNKVGVFVEDSFSTNGLMFGPDGRLYGCQNGKQRIVAFDREGRSTTIAEGVPSNDLVVTRSGDIYFTDPANHRVWHIPAGGKPRTVDEGIERPNGIILWPDQRTIVVADSAGDRLWTFRIEADGSLKFKQPYYTLTMLPFATRSGADGMTVDSAGRLYCTSMAGLQMFDPTGRLGGVIAKPQKGSLSNVVFAGPKLDTLYVTAGDKVFKRKTKVTGVRYTNVTK